MLVPTTTETMINGGASQKFNANYDQSYYVGLSYDNSIEQAERVLKTAVENASKQVSYLKRPIVILGIEKLNNDSVVYRIEAEVDPMKNFEFNRIFLKEVLKEAEANNLTLSYNKVDVHNA